MQPLFEPRPHFSLGIVYCRLKAPSRSHAEGSPLHAGLSCSTRDDHDSLAQRPLHAPTEARAAVQALINRIQMRWRMQMQIRGRRQQPNRRRRAGRGSEGSQPRERVDGERGCDRRWMKLRRTRRTLKRLLLHSSRRHSEHE